MSKRTSEGLYKGKRSLFSEGGRHKSVFDKDFMARLYKAEDDYR